MKYKSPRNGLPVHAYFLFIAFFLRLSLLDNLHFTYPMLFLFQNYDRQVAIAPFHAFLKLRVNAVDGQAVLLQAPAPENVEKIKGYLENAAFYAEGDLRILNIVL